MVSSSGVARRGIGLLGEVRRRAGRLRLPWLSLIIVTALVVCALFAPLLAPHDPTLISILDAKVAPGQSLAYPLGTDTLGRDMLSRLIHGARSAMYMALVALGSGALVGTLLGLIAGYRGGWVDSLIMRTVDAFLGFPTILLAMIMVVLLGAGMTNIILAVAVTVWANFARTVS